MKNIPITLAFIAITLLIFSQPIIAQGYKLKKVVIDAGHGGKDPGTHGKYLNEKDLVLKIALKVGGYIEKYIPDVEVTYIRKTDVYIHPKIRAEMANDLEADVFISIHANALPTKTSVYGTETYIMGTQNTGRNFEVAKRENSVILLEENYEEKYEGFNPNSPESYIMFSLTQSAFHENSLLLANYIEKQFKERAGRRSLGVKQSSLWVMWATAMPSVLVEIGYLTNPKEENELKNEQTQDYIASGIYRAFKEYKNQLESIN